MGKVLKVLNISGNDLSDDLKGKILSTFNSRTNMYDRVEVISLNPPTLKEVLEFVESYPRPEKPMWAYVDRFDAIIPPNSPASVMIFDFLNSEAPPGGGIFFILIERNDIAITATWPYSEF